MADLAVRPASDSGPGDEEHPSRLAWLRNWRPAGTSGWLLTGLFCLFVLAGLAVRFAANSPLWLDEAQSVAIAKLPLHGSLSLWEGLRQDGSPPLYYLLLHVWISIFGDGPVSVRTLSAVLSIACIPPLWLVARQVIGQRAARVALLVYLTSPFALYFATETRMYSLLLLLALFGALALGRMLRTPSVGSAAALAACTAAVALTHYWSLYLLFTLGLLLVLGGWRAKMSDLRRRCRLALGAMVLGSVLFVPWLPIFIYQLRHTGTPWGKPASFAALVHAFGQWSGGATTAGRLLLILSCALLAFAVFGSAVGPRQVLLDLRGSEPGRLLLSLSLGTLFIAVIVGMLVGNAWADRYTVTAFAPYLLCVALGTERLIDPKLLRATVVLLAVLGLAAGVPLVRAQRTQANQVAAVLRAEAKPGDVLLICPDQLGPALSREKMPPGLQSHVVPSYGPPGRVDWVDYKNRNNRADVPAIVNRALREAGPSHNLWLAYSDGYRTTEALCPAVLTSVQAAHRSAAQSVQAKDQDQVYEREDLFFFGAPRP